jgi:hypothetical protein
MQEKNDLLVFQQDNRSSFPKNTVPLPLHADGICKHLSAIVMPLTITHKKENVLSIALGLILKIKSTMSLLVRNRLLAGA